MREQTFILDLYCDNETKGALHTTGYNRFTGRSFHDCKQQARASGWKIGNNSYKVVDGQMVAKKARDLCPECSGKTP